MVRVEIVAVGTELLLGDLVDTNTPHVARALAQTGIDVYGTRAVGDNRQRIADALGDALRKADGVIVTGGLGPTLDDLTKEAVCDVLGIEPELHESALASMERRFAARGRTMRENNRKQALIPRGSTVLENRHGTAPGFIAETGGKFVAALPGVPSEMHPMLRESLIPWLRRRFDLQNAIYTRVLHTVDIAESEVDYLIADLFAVGENPKIAVLAHDYRVDVKLSAKALSPTDAQLLLEPLAQELRRRLDGYVFGSDAETLPGAIGKLLEQRRQTVAVAESCTGGSIAAAITGVAGSSKTFLGGVVAYADPVKVQTLGVNPQLLQRNGAVSEAVARAMAQGVRQRLKADVALSTTGVAGPEGGTAEKPVGLVWVGLSEAAGTRALRLQLHGERANVVGAAKTAALGWLWRHLLGHA